MNGGCVGVQVCDYGISSWDSECAIEIVREAATARYEKQFCK